MAQVVNSFNQATRRFIRTLPSVSYASLGTSSLDLPQTGFLAGLVLQLRGTTTTGATSSATARTYPGHPFNLIRRIRVSTSEGADICNLSGQGLYILQALQKSAWRPDTPVAGRTYGITPSPASRVWTDPSDLGANATQTWTATGYLPFAWTDSLLQGLLLAQNLGIRFTLWVDWGTTSDLYSATTGTVTVTAALTPQLVFFAVPEDSNAFPDIRFVHALLEERVPWRSHRHRFPYKLGNIYVRSIEEFVNIVSGAESPVTPDRVLSREFAYAQVQRIETSNADMDIYWQARTFGLYLPTGVYLRDWGSPTGIPELGGTRDVIDSGQVTDMTHDTVFDSGLSINADAFCRVITEQLVEVAG